MLRYNGKEWVIESPPFVLRDVIAKNWEAEAAGLVLFAIGMGLLIGVKPAPPEN